MRITFLAMGTENVSTEALSAALKQHGHEVNLAFDPSLFDDKMYFQIPFLAKLFDQKKKVIRKIINSKPELIGISLYSDNVQWAVYMAKEIKKRTKVPIVVGGMYVTNLPEKTLKNKCFDIACLGEGEYPLLELVESMEKGKIDYTIKNMWFRKGDKIIKNGIRDLIDIEQLPPLDKELFENDVKIQDVYLNVTVRGCPYSCTYCSQNFVKKFEKGKGPLLREQSVDKVIRELKAMKKKYKFKEMDLRNNTFSTNKKWALEFLKKYEKEIGIGFRAMTHPMVLNEEICIALKKAGCRRLQLGVESMDPWTRKHILHRHEADEAIHNGFKACDKAGIVVTVDHIMGLPYEKEKHLKKAVKTYSKYKCIDRVTPFWLSFFPKTDIINIAKEAGMINEKDIESINNANEGCYVFEGSIRDKKQIKMLKVYQMLFRAAPVVPYKVMCFILDKNIYKLLYYIPKTITFWIIDLYVSFMRFDPSAFWYMKHYWFWFKRIVRESIFGTLNKKQKRAPIKTNSVKMQSITS